MSKIYEVQTTNEPTIFEVEADYFDFNAAGFVTFIREDKAVALVANEAFVKAVVVERPKLNPPAPAPVPWWEPIPPHPNPYPYPPSWAPGWGWPPYPYITYEAGANTETDET